MATNKQLYIINYIINVALGIYIIIINLMHIVYIIMSLMIKNCI